MLRAKQDLEERISSVSPYPAYSTTLINKCSVSQEQKDEFRNDPAKYIKYRKEVEGELNSRFKLVNLPHWIPKIAVTDLSQLLKDTPEQAEAKRYSINEMKTKLGSNQRLIEKMIPEFAVGCRRPTPGNGYLEALSKPNVRVVTDHIDKIVPEGIALVTGEVLNVDTFICATGFDISFCPRFSLVGRNGIKLSEQWKDLPTAYLSLAADNFPNYFSEWQCSETTRQSLHR